MKVEKWYFETSGFNHLVNEIDPRALLNTRELQEIKGRELLVSPITLWEVMLTNDDVESERLIFFAQNFFSEKLLATPDELIVRYLRNAYPENKINYSFFTDLKIGDLWRRMTSDNSVNFKYSKSDLRSKTSFIRKISKNLKKVLDTSGYDGQDDFLASCSRIINTFYETLLKDALLPESKKYDTEALFKIVVLFILIFFVLNLGFDRGVAEEFWKKEDVGDDPMSKLIYLFESYPELLKRGPLLEMAVMAYGQLRNDKINRGTILDCLHMVYSPFVDKIVTGDQGFKRLSLLESRYQKKIVHVSEMNIRVSPFVK